MAIDYLLDHQHHNCQPCAVLLAQVFAEGQKIVSDQKVGLEADATSWFQQNDDPHNPPESLPAPSQTLTQWKSVDFDDEPRDLLVQLNAAIQYSPEAHKNRLKLVERIYECKCDTMDPDSVASWLQKQPQSYRLVYQGFLGTVLTSSAGTSEAIKVGDADRVFAFMLAMLPVKVCRLVKF